MSSEESISRGATARISRKNSYSVTCRNLPSPISTFRRGTAPCLLSFVCQAMLHSQRTGSTDRGTGYLPTRRTEQQWHELPLKMSPSKCIIIFSLVLLPFAEATAISRSRAAVLSAQLTRKSPPPESTFSKGVRFQVIASHNQTPHRLLPINHSFRLLS